MNCVFHILLFTVVTATAYALLDGPDTGVSGATSASMSEMQFLHQLMLQEQQTRIELQKQVTSFQNQLADMNEKINVLNGELATCKSDNRMITSDLNTLKARMSSLENRHSVSFFVRLKANIENHHQKDVMIFDDVQLNNGSAYDPSTGIFVAPLAGIYSFQLVLSAKLINEHGRIMHNGVVIQEIYADHVHPTYFGRGTGFAVLNLQQGDRVWIEHPDTGAGVINGGIYTSFSGFLVNAS